MPIPILGRKTILISDTSADIQYFERGYQMSCMWQRYDKGRISNKLNSKHRCPKQQVSTWGTALCWTNTWLHHLKSLLQVFFSALKNSFNISTDTSWYICNWPILADNTSKWRYQTGPNSPPQQHFIHRDGFRLSPYWFLSLQAWLDHHSRSLGLFIDGKFVRPADRQSCLLTDSKGTCCLSSEYMNNLYSLHFTLFQSFQRNCSHACFTPLVSRWWRVQHSLCCGWRRFPVCLLCCERPQGMERPDLPPEGQSAAQVWKTCIYTF